MDHRREARVGFVVTGGDAAELLNLAEEVLDQMAPLVHLEVAGDCGDPIGFGRDHGNRAPVVQLGAEPVAVEGFVRQQGSEVEIRQKRGDPHAVMSLSRQQDEPHEIAQRVDQRDDLGRQATARTPDGLRPGPSSCAGTVLVHPDDGAINDDVFEVGIRRQGFEKLIEHAASDPPTESLKHRVPLPEILGKVAPGRSNPNNPENRFDKKAVVSP